MYLLDTNHCSRIIQGEPTVLQAILNRRNAGVALSVIVQGELLFMAENSERRLENLEQVQTFLKMFDLYPISDEISRTYAQLKAALLTTFGPKDKAQRRVTRIQSLGLDDNDLWIAATALQHNLILVTTDSDFMRIQQVCNLQLESWVA
jgi:tRNA(fMet)-specific endonuclease VapC